MQIDKVFVQQRKTNRLNRKVQTTQTQPNIQNVDVVYLHKKNWTFRNYLKLLALSWNVCVKRFICFFLFLYLVDEDSPSVYLRDDYLGGPTELRAATAERAALFLDSALAARHQSSSEPALIFTLHVYQYSLAGRGGVAGGRSRLHLINIGGCANRSGGFPLSAIGNTLFAILGGQKHTPNHTHPLTPLLKDCLAPITCHVTILAHISCKQVRKILFST